MLMFYIDISYAAPTDFRKIFTRRRYRMNRFFTKSLYKKALECPTKLYYLSKADEYENNGLADPFLQALANGGFQVGELAKIYFPGGKEVRSKSPQDAIAETLDFLKQDTITLYEPAIQFGEFLIRVDILVKSGQNIQIYEVKSKSINPSEQNFYHKVLAKKGHYQFIDKWRSYFYDIAFQTMVCRGALSEFRIHPYLMFVDKSKAATVAGLNQRFVLSKEDGRIKVNVLPGTDITSVGEMILCSLDVAEDVERIFQGRDQGDRTREQLGMPSFIDEIEYWAKCYREGAKLEPVLTRDCKSCEFNTHGHKKSGFVECWNAKLKKDPPDAGLVIDLWNFSKAEELIQEGRLLIQQVTQEDLKITSEPDGGMSIGQRQWYQVVKASTGDKTPAVSVDYLRNSMKAWKFPLHCIDFEAARMAVPFHVNRRPYELIAFQFSHHVVHEDGTIEHAGEYLHSKRGAFPNFDFVRELKRQLDQDSGSIFRYSAFENTLLCDIYRQLRASSEPDKDQLMAFVQSVTKSKSNPDHWEGQRNMIDLLEIVKKAYYHPLMHGSNSIKFVLPAVLHESAYLKERYGMPIYGSAGGIPSRNFKDYIWAHKNAQGTIVDPYRQLPAVFDGIDPEVFERFLSDSDEIANGGAAMIAFGMMQFTEMTELEVQKLSQALLRYCELDTLAMVMIIEHFFELTGQLKFKQAG
jgi:hypothetical protein